MKRFGHIAILNLLSMGFAGSLFLLLPHLFWYGMKPSGCPAIPGFHRVQIADPPGEFLPNVRVLRLTNPVDGVQQRIAADELIDVRPGETVLVMDSFFFADNMPTITRVTPRAILFAYPIAWLVIFGAAIYVTSKFMRTRSATPA